VGDAAVKEEVAASAVEEVPAVAELEASEPTRR
jgi:hypothetical protein